MNDLEEFLRPVEDGLPCGADLTYDAEFLALENASRGKTEQQFGNTVIAAEQPDWRDVEKRAAALLARTKDVRVASALCRAWVNVRGLSGMAAGITLVVALMERYWDSVHPLPEDGDYFMRMNAVSSLDDVTGLLRDLRQADFLKSSAGVVSVREAEALVRGGSAETAGKMSIGQLRGALADDSRRDNSVVGNVSRISESLSRARLWYSTHLPGHQLPEMANLQSLLDALTELLPQTSEPGPDSPVAVEQEATAAAAPGSGSTSSVLRSREDAIASLLKVAMFVEQTEPTNPAPLLIRRAVRLMRMGFMDILRELSPDSLAQVENITGGKNET
jgi:type VI secretion system protein ImpA